MSELFIGLMSGTSLDGVDAVLADFSAPQPRLLAHHHRPFEIALRHELLVLNQQGHDELRLAALAANTLSREYAICVQALLDAANAESSAVAALGAHGQTVRHRPDLGYTLQLVNGALLAELTGIDVVCDFRSRDIAAGGHGAPLAPAFHQAVFASRDAHRVIVNIGGIANLTDLPPDGKVSGFDCGPGNLLLDAWAQQHLHQPFDRDGAWAHSGRVLPELLGKLCGHEFFRRVPPKSAGRETFNLEWLEPLLPKNVTAADVQATLLALTAGAIADAVEMFCGSACEVYLCGGGARNAALVKLLEEQLKDRKVAATDALGIKAEHVEALAFAWLARQRLRGEPGNLPAVTGARGARVLGAVYQK
ncbi:MAG TPA: anhydro-N-acetylmuramic acid kinase [Burkholderiales bacterium]|nr:anhydro-N-acetylmuramic acid kinase [Burkholderiales bacterium]